MSLAAAPDRAARLAANIVAAHGEPVMLPGGAVLSGVFDVFAPRPEPLGSEQGRTLRASQLPNPTLDVTAAAAAAHELREGSLLSVRGVDYRIARIDPDGFGMVRAFLATYQPPRVGAEMEGWQ
jgi:hypothetical protein